MQICVGKLTIIASDNGLSPGRRQAIIWTNAGILLIRPLETNFSERLSEIHIFSFKKMHLKLLSAKCRPFCFGLNVLSVAHKWQVGGDLAIQVYIPHVYMHCLLVIQTQLGWFLRDILWSLWYHEVHCYMFNFLPIYPIIHPWRWVWGDTRSQGISSHGIDLPGVLEYLGLSIRKVNSLWPNDDIWWHRSGSTLAKVMACCLKAWSHYLGQCQRISKVQ